MNKSFTLIEILVVIVVIGILSAFILVGMSSITSSANIAKVQAFINSMDNALLLGRVSQWKFDELTTAKEAQPIRDSWGSNNGTLYTGSDGLEKISSNCPSGNCLSFDGSNDYVRASTSILSTNSYSIAMWFMSLDNTLGKQIFEGNILSSPSLEGTDTNYGWYVGNTAAVNTGPITVGKWYHFVGTFNKGTGLRKLFLDGVLVGTNTNTTSHDISTFYIASRTGTTRFWNGLVDDVRIYNQAIPTSEIQQNYFVGLNNLYKNNGITLNEFNQRIGELKTNLVKNE